MHYGHRLLYNRKNELRRLDSIDGVHGANLQLAAEIRENKSAVAAARETKRKLEKTEKLLKEGEETAKRLREEKKKNYDSLYRERETTKNLRDTTTDLRKKLAEYADIDELRSDHDQLWVEFDEMRAKCDDLQAKLVEMEEEMEKLRDAQSTTIQTTDSRGQYLPEFRYLMMKVLGHNVPHAHASAVIKDVLAYAGREASDLPVERVIRERMNIERLGVSHRHIGVRTNGC